MTSLRSTTTQIPASGSPPDAEALLLGAVCGALAADAADIAALIDGADFDAWPNAEVWAAIRTALAEGPTYSPAAVLDVLTRRGARREVRVALLDAVSAGAASSPGALRVYAAAVVAQSYRRRLESVGHALIQAADCGPETALAGQLDAAVTVARGIAERLLRLRGDSL